MSTDRRNFLRRAALLGCALPLGGALACREDASSGTSREARASGDSAHHRPILQPWSDGSVHLVAPPVQRPLAYLSRAERRVYIDPDHRDTVQRLLVAYVSVSTDLWRIPLPGDDPRVPIPPDNEPREFEPWDLWAWDPVAPPALGDVRIVAAAPVRRSFGIGCAPIMAGGGGWVSSPTLDITSLAGPPGEPAREEFRQVAVGTLHPDRECREGGTTVRILSWVSDPT